MRHIGKLALLAASAASAGGLAFFASGRIASAASGVKRGTCANPLPRASGGAAMAQVPIVASQMRALWPSMVGGTMSEAAVEIALAQAMLESGIGTWWKDKSAEGEGRGSMVGSHNLGARQCGLRDEGGSDYTCVEYGDSRPNADGTQTYFPAKFRFYSSLEAGVKDFLYSITRQWPAVAELQSGDVLGYAIKQGPKYRADDKPNQSVFGREYKGGNGYYGGFGATMQDRVGGYGRAIASHLPAIAAALGHTKIEACIAPELAAKGKAHASTAGADIGASYSALHMAGLLPRARVIPGTHGTEIVWYLESPTPEERLAKMGQTIERVTAECNETDRLYEQAMSDVQGMLQEAKSSALGASGSHTSEPFPSGDERPPRATCYYCGAPYAVDRTCRNCSNCGKQWFGPRLIANATGTCFGEREGRNPFCGCASCDDTSGPHVHAVCPDASREPPVEGVGTGIAVGLVSAVLATAAGKLIEDKIEDRENIAKAKRVIAGIQSAGFDVLSPGASPKIGWQVTGANDARLLEALAFLGSQRDEVLQNLVSAGYGFQKKSAGPVAKVSGGCCSPPEPEDIEDINEFVAAVQAGEEVTVTTADIETIEGPAAGIVIAIVGAALATAAGVGVEKLLKKDDDAKRVIGALRTAGFDVIEPKASPRKGWVEVHPANSPKLLAALDFLGDKRDVVLREMAAKGLRFQTQLRIRIPASVVAAAKKPARSGLEEDRGSIAALRAIPGVTVTTLEEDRGSLAALLSAPSPLPSVATVAPVAPVALPASASATITRDEMVAMFPNYTPAQIDEAMKNHGTPVQGIEGFADGLTTGLGVVASLAIVMAAIGVVGSGKEIVESVRAIFALNRAGFEILAPGEQVKSGWTIVALDDPRVLKALTALGTARDPFLKTFADMGWRIQAKSASVDSVSGEKDVTPEHAEATDAYMTSMSGAERSARRVSGIDDVRNAANALQFEGVGVVAAVVGGGLAAGVLAAMALKKKEEPAAPIAPAPAPVVTAPAAAKAPPVVPAPAAQTKPPSATAAATKAQEAATFADANVVKLKDELTQILSQPAPDGDAVRRKLAELKEAELAAAAIPSRNVSEGKLPVSGVIGPTTAAIASYVAGAAMGVGATLLTQKALSSPRDVTTITPEPPPPVAPPPAPQPRVYVVKPGDSPFKIATLHDANKRPNWWKELADANPQKEKKGIPWGWKQLLPGESLIIPREWPSRAAIEGAGKTAAVVAGGLLAAAATGVGIAAVVNPEKAKANFDRFVHGEAIPKSNQLQGAIQWGHIGAKNEQDEVDKAVATGSDVADAAGGLLQLVSAGKRIVERQATAPDPECRKKVKAFVEKHPLIARWYANDLRQLAGSESSSVSLGASMSWGDLVEWFKDTSPPGDACCIDGRWMPDCPDTHPGKAKCHPNIIERVKRFVHLAGTEQFVDQYTDELLRHRSERGIECGGAPTGEEDKAVLGAVMASLGLSREEEDAVYTAASRGVGTLLDLYAPGAGQGATQASDALSALITGRKMAPHAAPAKAAAPKAKTDKALLAATAALQNERAKVARFNTWMREHPLRSFLVPDEIRSISGASPGADMPDMSGVGKTVAIVAGSVLAAGGATAGILYEREHRLSGERVATLRTIFRKHGWDIVPTGQIPAGYVAAMGSFLEPGFGRVMDEYKASLSALDKVMPSGDPATVLGWALANNKMQLVRKADATEGSVT